MSILVNGVAASRVETHDRGLQYGDGLFETIACKGGRLRLWNLHLERLLSGCERLALPAPDPALLEQEARSVVDHADAVVKIIVTRGPGQRGYRAPDRPVPTRIVAAYPWPGPLQEWHNRGLRVVTCKTPISLSPALAGLKHLGRLEQVLARSEWSDDRAEEGLMLDPSGNVVCATQANLFAAVDGELVTPPVDRAGVAGVMRRAVLSWADARGIAAREAQLRPADLRRAGEVFLTSAILGACPVSEVDGNPVSRGMLATEFQAWLTAD